MNKILLVYFILMVSLARAQHFYHRYGDAYWLFGSKTVYNEVAGHMSLDIEGCIPTQLIMLVSNGTTMPSKRFIDFKLGSLEFWKNTVNRAKTKLSEEEINEINNWKQHMEADTDTDLNNQSIIDLWTIGGNVNKTFHSLFDDKNILDKIQVRAANFKLSDNSTEQFMKAIFNFEHPNEFSTCYENDYMFMLEAFKKNNDPDHEKYNKQTEEEVQQFRKSNSMTNTIQNIKRKMGLVDTVLTYEDIFAMYESCRTERSFAPNSNKMPPWCAVFSQEDFEVMEFEEDLYWYHYIGPGNPFNRKASSLILHNITETLINMVDKQGPLGLFYMVPKENILNLLVNLGVFDEEPYLTHSKFDYLKYRKFRTSIYIPWTANIMIVLNECNNDEQKVSFFVNETPLTLKMYNGKLCHVCPFQDVIMTF